MVTMYTLIKQPNNSNINANNQLQCTECMQKQVVLLQRQHLHGAQSPGSENKTNMPLFVCLCLHGAQTEVPGAT